MIEANKVINLDENKINKECTQCGQELKIFTLAKEALDDTLFNLFKRLDLIVDTTPTEVVVLICTHCVERQN